MLFSPGLISDTGWLQNDYTSQFCTYLLSPSHWQLRLSWEELSMDICIHDILGEINSSTFQLLSEGDVLEKSSEPDDVKPYVMNNNKFISFLTSCKRKRFWQNHKVYYYESDVEMVPMPDRTSGLLQDAHSRFRIPISTKDKWHNIENERSRLSRMSRSPFTASLF